MNINMANLFASLKIMGIGMVTIFVVILVIMLLVMILTKVTSKKDGAESEK